MSKCPECGYILPSKEKDVESRDILIEAVFLCKNPKCQAVIDLDGDRVGFKINGNVTYSYKSYKMEEI